MAGSPLYQSVTSYRHRHLGQPVAASAEHPASEIPLAVVSIDGRVLHANSAASVLFQAGKGLFLLENRLQVPELSAALRVALAGASGLLGTARPCAMPLLQHDGRLTCLPLPPAWSDTVFSLSRCALLLVVPRRVAAPALLWQQVFKLSKDECKLAHWLLSEHATGAQQFDWLISCLQPLLEKTAADTPEQLLHRLALAAGLGNTPH